MPASTEYVLTLSCPDRVGIVHAVAAYLHQAGCNVLDSQQFGDRIAGRFFMRVHVEAVPGAAVTYESLYGGITPVAAGFGMEWELHDTAVRPRVLIMVSKAGHCLNDLLYRRAAESLRIDVPLVVGNHPDLAPLAAAYGVPFEHVPAGTDPAGTDPASTDPASTDPASTDPASTDPASTDAAGPLGAQRSEGRVLDLVSELGIDFVVLARYMRILSPDLCAKMAGRIINIHHSFLPSFKGARPYHQAHAHGVKLIGATAHYVTADLDEGPIIEQEVARVDHSDGPEDLAAIGRDAERVALARAVRWHAEHRVLLHGRRTVIFR
jgi:formyltetrahydrofolate deformylase